MACPSTLTCGLLLLSYSLFIVRLTSTFYLYEVSTPPSPYHVDLGTASLRVVRTLFNDTSAISGLASQPGLHGCDHFDCPLNYKAVRTSSSVDDLLNRTAKHTYCYCLPIQDADLLNTMLRVADLTSSATILQLNRVKFKQLEERLKELEDRAFELKDRVSGLKDPAEKLRDRTHTISRRVETISRKGRVMSKRSAPVADANNFTYVPPPKTDVTPALLAESLAVQPQDTATIGSIMPHFLDGVISYGVQLNGLIAATMTLNASTSLPCANIGTSSGAQPDLVLRPKDLDNGPAQAYIPDCSIIAVNMYDPNVINYWVMNQAGAIFSLVGSNKVMQIDQINSTASVALVLRASTTGNTRRDTAAPPLRGSDDIVKRAMSQPDIHTASMSAEACAAMICNNNGGKPAVFNPFTKNCWCQDPVYVEIEHA